MHDSAPLDEPSVTALQSFEPAKVYANSAGSSVQLFGADFGHE